MALRVRIVFSQIHAKYGQICQIWYLARIFGRSCKMQLRRNDLGSIWPPSQKLLPNQILKQHPNCNFNVKLELDDQKYRHGKERLKRENQKQFWNHLWTMEHNLEICKIRISEEKKVKIRILALLSIFCNCYRTSYFHKRNGKRKRSRKGKLVQ